MPMRFLLPKSHCWSKAWKALAHLLMWHSWRISRRNWPKYSKKNRIKWLKCWVCSAQFSVCARRLPWIWNLMTSKILKSIQWPVSYWCLWTNWQLVFFKRVWQKSEISKKVWEIISIRPNLTSSLKRKLVNMQRKNKISFQFSTMF